MSANADRRSLLRSPFVKAAKPGKGPKGGWRDVLFEGTDGESVVS